MTRPVRRPKTSKVDLSSKAHRLMAKAKIHLSDRGSHWILSAKMVEESAAYAELISIGFFAIEPYFDDVIPLEDPRRVRIRIDPQFQPLTESED